MPEQLNVDEQRKTLRRIINAAHTAFLVTHSLNTGLHGRPMQTAAVDDDMATFFFPTAIDSGKVEELAADASVFLGYVHGNEWATISGQASIVDDRQTIARVWTPLWKNWFSGPDDPKLVLIAVQPEAAEYWDSSNQIIALAKMAFTAVTGKKTSLGEHAKVGL